MSAPTPADYVAGGLKLVRLSNGSKAPTGEGWQLETNCISTLEQAELVNGCSVGLAHLWSGTCAIDADDYQACVEWLAKRRISFDAHMTADDAVQISSGRPNRCKLIFRLPDGVRFLPTLNLRESHGVRLELRCADRNGTATVQDVLPPSIHPDTGLPYEWIGDWRNFPELPEAFLALWRELSNREGAKQRTEGIKDGVIPIGARNATMVRMAGAMRRQGMSASEICAALMEVNKRCEERLSGEEIAKISASIGKYPPGVDDEWPAPQPLTVTLAPEPYPLDALPGLIRGAVEEVQAFIKAPDALVASSAIGATSAGLQSYIDVRRVPQLEGPISANLLTIADSGERKTTADTFFTAAIRAYEAQQAEIAEPEVKKYNAEIAAWTAEKDGLLMAIRSAAKAGRSIEALRLELVAAENAKPEAPRVPRLLRMDDTPEKLAWVLAKEWPAAAVLSSEAAIVFGGHAMGKDSVMRNLALLNVLWDGGTFHIGRRTTESFTVKGARLTLALQIQEAVLRRFIDQTCGLARGVGFLARFLLAWPDSTQGFRPFSDPGESWPKLAGFNQRMSDILNTPASIDEQGALTPAMLSLSPKAKIAWVEYHDMIEAQLRAGGDLYDVRDAASKSADNAARLAAQFQVMQHGEGGTVELDAFEGASVIAAWHLNESRRFFGELALPRELGLAARLDGWLAQHCSLTGAINKRYAQQYGPLRENADLSLALDELVELDRVRLGKEGKRPTIYLNPALIRGGL
jgi:hypothetical protein